MNPAMYIFLNQGLGMSTGKSAAQAAHAAVLAYALSSDDLIYEWNLGGHYTKLIMAARDTEHLNSIERYLADRGFETALVIDEGRTEVAPHTPTALGVEIVNKDDPHAKATFEGFKTYRDPKPEPDLTEKPDIGPKIPEDASIFTREATPIGVLMNAAGVLFEDENKIDMAAKAFEWARKTTSTK